MSWPYKKVLIIGATSGIGEALAIRCVNAGSNVIVTGRRQERLADFVHKYGKDKASAITLDITELSRIPDFAKSITESHSDLDCIILNSGIQRSVNFTKPDTVNIDALQTEFTTNYFSYLALTKAFLPFFQGKKDPSSLVYMSSGLALVPLIRCANYSASKAAMHHFVLVLREQLKDSNIKVTEIFPPAVQTELHDEKHQPDIKNGSSIGMPINEFTDAAINGLMKGEEQIGIGMAGDWLDSIEPPRKEKFVKLTELYKRGAP